MSTTNDNSVITRGFLKAYHDRLKTTIPTKGSDLTNDLNWASGTVTSVAVKMNNTTKGTITSSGTIDLGTVITAHQDISGKADSNTAVSSTSPRPLRTAMSDRPTMLLPRQVSTASPSLLLWSPAERTSRLTPSSPAIS